MRVPVSDIDFYSDAVILDPYPVYAELRELGPVVYLPRHDLYLVARYKEVSEILLQPLRFVSSRGVSPIPAVNLTIPVYSGKLSALGPSTWTIRQEHWIIFCKSFKSKRMDIKGSGLTQHHARHGFSNGRGKL